MNLKWLDDCVTKGSVMDDKFSCYGFMFKDQKLYLIDTEDDEIYVDQTKQLIRQHSGEIVKTMDEVLSMHKEVKLLMKDDQSNKFVKDMKKFIQKHKLTYDDFKKLKIISTQWVYDSIDHSQLGETAEYDLVFKFKTQTQGDQSFFHSKPLAKQPPKKPKTTLCLDD